VSVVESIQRLVGYKAWANQITFAAVQALPAGEATKQRPTRYKNMVYTLNHVYVIDRIFQAHLTKQPHSYTDRNTAVCPSLEVLWDSVQLLDQWYLDYGNSVSELELLEVVPFQFVDGGLGRMTRSEMILHVVNHGTYHRGLVSDMMYQVPAIPPANDFTVYLRDVAYAKDLAFLEPAERHPAR
jgi:uncharacterized damage-inducible protein DinB